MHVIANQVLVNEQPNPITTKYDKTHYKVNKKEENLGFTFNFTLNMLIHFITQNIT